MSVFWLRVVLGALLLAIVAVAAIPLLVLLDLASGGTGWGLCPTGLSGCSTTYTAGPELAATLVIALFVLVAAVRFIMRAIRRMERSEGRLTLWNFLGGGSS